jgi:hypothetical protein
MYEQHMLKNHLGTKMQSLDSAWQRLMTRWMTAQEELDKIESVLSITEDLKDDDADASNISTHVPSPTLEGENAQETVLISYEASTFWTGRSSEASLPSIRSRHSSRNSSLRGVPQFDPYEQNPVFTASHHGSARSEGIETFPSLPPPPVELGKVRSFECDICGQTVKVHRRFQWQYGLPCQVNHLFKPLTVLKGTCTC